MSVDRSYKLRVATPKDKWNAPVIDAKAAIPKAAPAPEQDKEFNWKPWVTAIGGGLLLHTIASSLMNRKSDEEKSRESIWERLLSTIIPIGIGGLGMYGGYRLGNLMKSGESPMVTNDWVRVISENGGQAMVPENIADRMDALFKYLPDNHGKNVTLEDIDAAWSNLNSRVKADQGSGGSFIRGGEKATTLAQPLVYGAGAGIAGYGAYQMFKNSPGAVRKNFNSALDTVKFNADSVEALKKQPRVVQENAAIANGSATPEAFYKDVAAKNKQILADSAEFKKNAPKNRMDGAKNMLKSLPWFLGGGALSFIDSYLENKNEEAEKAKGEAEFWRQNAPKIRAILNESNVVE